VAATRNAAPIQRNDLGDIINGLFGGSNRAQDNSFGLDDAIGLIGGLLGGQQSQGGSGNLIGIINDLIGNASHSPNQGGSGVDLHGILDSLLGGGTTQQRQQDDDGFDLTDLVGLFNGQTGQPAGNSGDLFSALTGMLGAGDTNYSGQQVQGSINKRQDSIADHIRPSQTKSAKPATKRTLRKRSGSGVRSKGSFGRNPDKDE
jgi:hypothetical protein